MDGGTFANEPLREAFRIAAFLDGSGGSDSERVVLFVDPNVSSLDEPELRVPILRQFDDKGRRIRTAGRLAAHVGTMLAALRSESSVSEADKVYRIRRHFDLRKDLRVFLGQSLDRNAGPLTGDAAEAIRNLRLSCDGQLHRVGEHASLPPTLLSLGAELERVIREEPALLGSLSGKAETFLESQDLPADPDAGMWLLALHFVALDLALGLEGKRDVVVAPIAPMWDPEDPESAFDLPNEAVGTFAGLMSATAQCFTLAAGRHCATRFLANSGLVPSSVPMPARPAWAAEDEKSFRKEVERGVEPLMRRLRSVIDGADVIPLFDGLVAKGLCQSCRTA